MTTRPHDQLGRPIWRSYEMGYLMTRKYKSWVVDTSKDVNQKVAALNASHSVVGVINYGVSPELTKNENNGSRRQRPCFKEVAFRGSGTIIEREDLGDNMFRYVIITTATLFTRTTAVEPTDVKVHVSLVGRHLYEGKVLACDFHYNLAAISIEADTAVPAANFKDLDDVITIDQSESLRSRVSRSYQLRSRPSSVKIRPGDTLMAIGRQPMRGIHVDLGPFCPDYPAIDCKEVFSILDIQCFDLMRGGAVITDHGELIGILAVKNYFLPSNLVSRWWSYFKQHGTFARPRPGVIYFNLHTARMDFLESFLLEFPNLRSGVIVSEVLDNSAAYRSGLRSEDVITECDGASVRSSLELYGKILEKAGQSVVLTVARRSTEGESMKLTMSIDEVTLDNFYRWPIPEWSVAPKWRVRRVAPESSDSDSDSEMSEVSNALSISNE